MNNKEFEKILIEGKEYYIIPDGETCGDIGCGAKDRCKTCDRINSLGEVKIPTGRKIIHD